MSLVEFFTRDAEPEQFPTTGPLSIRPVVADANALLSDVYYAAAHHRSALLDAADLGVARLYAPMHIYHKVYARLPELARGDRVGLLEEAHRLWDTEYLKLVRFVDVGDMPTEASRRLADACSTESPWLATSSSGQTATQLSSSRSIIAVRCSMRCIAHHFDTLWCGLGGPLVVPRCWPGKVRTC